MTPPPSPGSEFLSSVPWGRFCTHTSGTLRLGAAQTLRVVSDRARGGAARGGGSNRFGAPLKLCLNFIEVSKTNLPGCF